MLLVAPAMAWAQDQPPRFRSGVDVTSVDVTVVDNRGRPLLGLGQGDFTVQVDGTPRRVVSVDWVPLTSTSTTSAPGAPKPPPLPEGYTSNEGGAGGRLILLVIDQPNIRFGGFVGIRNAVNGFVDRLQPADRIAVVGIGPGAPSVPFTADRERVKQAIDRTTGQRQTLSTGFYNIAISEAMSIRRGDGMLLRRVQVRECGDPATAPPTEIPRIEMCFGSVEAEAQALASSSANDGEQTMNIFRALLNALKTVNAPNTLVMVTEGFVLDESHPSFTDIGNLAAQARTSIYVLKLDEPAFDIAQRQAPTARFEDRFEKSVGIESLAGATRGSVFNVVAGADPAFERIESELSGFYLVAVESDPLDKDGKPHAINVSVNRRGVTVRSRRQLTALAEDSRPRSPREQVMASLASPLVLSALPLRVATFALNGQGPEAAKVQLLIHADVGVNYSSARPVSLAYMITDLDGLILESQAVNARLAPVMNGVPSPLQFTAGASVPPGEYILKLAVGEGDLVGSIEHRIHATLLNVGRINFSELMVGGPANAAPLLRPTIGHTVSFGNVQGYLEAYGPGVKELKITYEIANSLDGPPILNADVPAQSGGGDRAIFSRVMAVRQLPPGTYVLRAMISADAGLDKSPVTMARAFEIAPPAVLMASVDNAPAPPLAATELFLPVGDEIFARSFHRDQVARPAILQAFRERLAPASVAAFDRGVALLAAGDYAKAEISFKEAIHPDGDSAAPLTYLAAAFAAAGHDREAASAWQMALIDGTDVPEIYQWLSDALLRVHDLPQARAILEEAVAKWPADSRFAKPLAMLYATFGLGREAVRTLTRHLEAHPDDVEGLSMGVEWIYNLHSLGAVARSRGEDVKLARTYAAAYERAKGPQVELVKQWIGFIEGRTP